MWTFGSGHVDGAAPLPLLSPRYRLPLPLSNALDRHRPVHLELTAEYLGGAAAHPRAPRIWISYDDGTTWPAVAAFAVPGGTVHALVPPPGAGSTAGYASLHLQFTDRSDNTVDQTVVRAYRLARR